MNLSPYSPPGFVTFGAIALLFLLALVFLPRNTSKAVTAYMVTALSILPSLVSFIWVYWIHHSLATAGYSGPGDPREIIWNILHTALAGIVMSFVMLVISGIHTFRAQKRPDSRR